MSDIEKKIRQAIDENIFSGIALEVTASSKTIYSSYLGKTALDSTKDVESDSIFDIASLTKPLSTALITGIMVDKGLISFENKISNILDDYSISYNRDIANISIEQLLNHSSGHEPWFGLYTLVDNRSAAYMLARTRPLFYEPGTKHVYSDLAYIILGELLEILSQKKLDTLFSDLVSRPLGLSNIKFMPVDKERKELEDRFVSTGFSKVRRRELIAEVNDENSYILNGVSGHSGLFSTASDVSSLAQELMDITSSATNDGIISKKTFNRMIKKAKTSHEWCMGWHYPSDDSSTSGRLLSPNSIGMTGFTGCSLWLDLERKMIITMLANRTVAPDSAVSGGQTDRFTSFRPMMHELIVKELGL